MPTVKLSVSGRLKPHTVTAAKVKELVAAGLIEQVDDDDAPHFVVVEELAADWPDLSLIDLSVLARILPLLDKRERLTDTETLDVINYIVSAPEWSPSFLEDIVDVLRKRAGRAEIRGALWASH